MVFAIRPIMNRASAATGQIIFWSYSALMGVTFSAILMMYTGDSVARVFFITSGTFAGMSLWGYTTKRDLNGMGHFLMMGLFGLIIASIVNIFMQSPVIHFLTSFLGVAIFVGLTAYDTQKIRQMYNSSDSSKTQTKKSVMGALKLYLDFINLFLYLLRFMGTRR